ncbi:MAG: glycosyltransferase family 2 protein [Alphaproteobacteria bacterium PRO2]|nr:glycosyltransferase family 2 protein [Alphaproteobacteria bacterium PRO2]
MLSIVIPVYNEKENIRPLLEEISAVARSVPVTEVLYVDDGSDDGTHLHLQELSVTFPFLRIIRHSKRSGQSRGLWSGVSHATGPLIVTLDGDGQNDPADIPLLFELYQKQAAKNPRVMIAGQRAKRHDNLVRRLSSRAANAIRSYFLKDGTKDTGCSLKLFRREDYIALPYFNHMHRYLPALMKGHYVEVCHVDVSHRPRGKGVSKYGFFDRLWAGVHDLFGVRWLLKRARPDIIVSELNAARENVRELKR